MRRPVNLYSRAALAAARAHLGPKASTPQLLNQALLNEYRRRLIRFYGPALRAQTAPVLEALSRREPDVPVEREPQVRLDRSRELQSLWQKARAL